ncbi:MAG: hypothetical protein KGH74_00375 [Candidatus Micrarchaeota archaeon]|nr:hypothetical protein [Candidatus Micrarchaeota archaeon]
MNVRETKAIKTIEAKVDALKPVLRNDINHALMSVRRAAVIGAASAIALTSASALAANAKNPPKNGGLTGTTTSAPSNGLVGTSNNPPHKSATVDPTYRNPARGANGKLKLSVWIKAKTADTITFDAKASVPKGLYYLTFEGHTVRSARMPVVVKAGTSQLKQPEKQPVAVVYLKSGKYVSAAFKVSVQPSAVVLTDPTYSNPAVSTDGTLYAWEDAKTQTPSGTVVKLNASTTLPPGGNYSITYTVNGQSSTMQQVYMPQTVTFANPTSSSQLDKVVVTYNQTNGAPISVTLQVLVPPT